MRLQTFLFASLVWMLSYTSCLSQNDAQVTAPNYVPPSPDAASLGKFADFPVGTYTGTPDITIPLTTIKVRDVSFPLTLSYHASGIRVEEEASWVGLGWTLNAGGAITRTIRGNDDLSTTNRVGYVYSSAVPAKPPYMAPPTDPCDILKPDPNFFNPSGNANDLNYLLSTAVQSADAQPDIFYYNLMGHTGKFYLKQKTSPSDPITAVLLSNEENIQINYDPISMKWTVITDDGFKFVLGTVEYTKSYSFQLYGYELLSQSSYFEDYASSQDTNYGGIPLEFPNSGRAVTAWYVDQIFSPTNEKVTFNYSPLTVPQSPKLDQNPSYTSKSIVSFSETRQDAIGLGVKWAFDVNCPMHMSINPLLAEVDLRAALIFGATTTTPPCLSDGNVGSLADCSSPGNFGGSMNVVFHRYLTGIQFNNGTSVNFITSERNDLEQFTDQYGSGGTRRFYQKPRKLDRIEISGAQSFKGFQFNNGYFNGDNQNDFKKKRLRLNSVTEYSIKGAKKPYVFTYYGDSPLGANGSLPSKYSLARDHWGLYNGKDANGSLIPEVLFKTISVGIKDGDCDQRVDIKTDEGYVNSIPGGNRNADENSSLAATLKNIKYPTGGSTDFVFESNTFNIPEGTAETKDFEVTSEAGQFDLDVPTRVAITADLNCLNKCPYSHGTDKTCADINPIDAEPYLELKDAKDKTLWAAYYDDFITTSNDVTKTECGVERKLPFTDLAPGTYKLVAHSLNGYIASGFVSYSRSVPVDPSNLVKKGGGLRIKSIVDHDGIDPNNDVIRNFDYTMVDGSGRVVSAGKLMSNPLYSYFSYNTLARGNGTFSACFKVISDSYSNIPLGSSARGNAVGYDQVTVSYGANGENGKSVFFYRNQPEETNFSPGESFFPNSPTTTHSPSNGQLLRQIDYTADGKKIRETINNYELNTETEQQLTGMVSRLLGSGQQLQYHFYTEPSEWWHLSGSYQVDYDVNDPNNLQATSKITRFFYDNFDHKLLTRKESTSSEGEAISELWQYPLDAMGEVPHAMWDVNSPNFKNLQNSLVRHTVSVNGALTLGEKNDYSYLSNQDVVVVSAIEKATRSGVFEPRVTMNSFDSKGNVVDVSKVNDTNVAYVWGYNGTLPVAQVVNAKSNQVFYEGFEDAGDVTRSKTGLKSYAGAYKFDPPSGFSPAANTIVSYWYWDDTPKKKWIYKETPYTSNFMTPESTNIDEFRVFPASAKMTTYTYDPLVGITTATDPNGQTVYYQYDDLNRLKSVKDFNGNVVKRFDYQYKD
ncbi:MAG TPA: RHS repeat domain-containing protein [Cyclobacteriaceae bacterium]|jgi:YD repeat-containing protein|nr:RHS repeat domain-containing protein [Cyclobacteriaceae bacterium]